jgi:hypothetical protein
MNTDIRLKCNFTNHIKTKKLIKKLGYEGFYSLISLWCYAAQNKPKGILDMSVEDIAIAANWTGDPEMFVTALIQCGFLEKGDGGVLVLHDWEEHNRYAYYAEERSQAARKLVARRWAKRLKCNENNDLGNSRNTSGNTNGIRSVYEPYYESYTEGNTPIPIPNPIPSPIPIPTPNIEGDCKGECLSVTDGVNSSTQSANADFVPSDSNKVTFDEKNKVFLIPEAILEKYKQAYPAVDIEGEIRKMEAWVLSQPKSRWKKDWRRFIAGWLSREQDKAEYALARGNGRKGGFLDD